ncbi:40S ribosome biogenesis protein Tsr1 and BMS1 C-terminal, putative [Angomonas deanei]|uniref:40S ribosome biogenesis protein Tsr1 and BMS1 C-terminal, putative n=1 Tax=Angomonas deanei TaxID=59799 RepID=A0A7G2CHD3_9TRYP|nr:40S ribosome biogenesis protein Tsr1 and BMS1 C-terminal, putative [Angomonas deanei]
MFSSDVEASKFVGAKLKSVSGVRGIIKSVLKGKNGLVRATFEDKIFPSDIVFIRAWKSVEPPEYCAMQRNLLDPTWVGMKTMRELRWERGITLTENKDSEYKDIKRRHRAEAEGEDKSGRVMLSRNTRMQLPFEMKEGVHPD